MRIEFAINSGEPLLPFLAAHEELIHQTAMLL
jgi:hypothetical protein